MNLIDINLLLGVPYTTSQFSATIDLSEYSGWKWGAGRTSVDPWNIALVIETIPATWKNGRFEQIVPACLWRSSLMPESFPLFTKLIALRIAALGWPVVPEVNWMLQPESGEIEGCSASICAASLSDTDLITSLYAIVPLQAISFVKSIAESLKTKNLLTAKSYRTQQWYFSMSLLCCLWSDMKTGWRLAQERPTSRSTSEYERFQEWWSLWRQLSWDSKRARGADTLGSSPP
jgi:hypothetical protein